MNGSVGWKRAATLVAALAVTASTAMAQTWTGSLLGASEVPPVVTSAFGKVVITQAGGMLTVNLTWSGLLGGAPSAAHIHCCTPIGNNVGVAVGFTGFPATTAGSYSNTFDLSDPNIYTAAFRNNFGGGTAAGSAAALIAGLNAGQAYVNIHNRTNPGGEIRALVTATPEPETWALMATGLLGLGAIARRKRSV